MTSQSTTVSSTTEATSIPAVTTTLITTTIPTMTTATTTTTIDAFTTAVIPITIGRSTTTALPSATTSPAPVTGIVLLKEEGRRRHYRSSITNYILFDE